LRIRQAAAVIGVLTLAGSAAVALHLTISQREHHYTGCAENVVCARVDVPAGAVLTEDHLRIRPVSPLQARGALRFTSEAIGKRVLAPISKDQPIRGDDLGSESAPEP
jgi:Flp pilus assembly protein CpaB